MKSKSNQVLLLDTIQESILDVVQKAKSSGNTIETIDPQFKVLLREIYSLFHFRTVSTDEEQVNQRMKLVLKSFLESTGNEFLYNYSNSLPNLQNKEVITSIIILLLAQKLFAVFTLFLMTLKDLQSIYKEDAILMKLDDLIVIQKAFIKYEGENIQIQSKGVQHFFTLKQ